MTAKRCTDCRYAKGIGYDFWCGEGHTEYEVFGAETNCPYYEYHDWSKGIPSKTVKRFKHSEIIQDDGQTICYGIEDTQTRHIFNVIGEGIYDVSEKELIKLLNELHEENEQLKQENNELKEKNEFLQKRIDCIIQSLQNDLNTYGMMGRFE